MLLSALHDVEISEDGETLTIQTRQPRPTPGMPQVCVLHFSTAPRYGEYLFASRDLGKPVLQEAKLGR